MGRCFDIAVSILWAVGLAAVCGAEIYSENIVGIQAVECAGTNVVLAVPFVATEGGDITVSNLLGAAGLAPGDRLFRWDGDRYERWKLDKSGDNAPLQWAAEKTFTVERGGTKVGTETSMSADVRTVGVGTGLWLTRTNGIPTRIFLAGTVTNEIPVVSVPNLSTRIVANPLEEAARPTIKTPAEGDTIQFPTSAGPLRVYRFVKGDWVCSEGGTQKAGLLPLVPAGTGFWYVSMGTKEVQISWGK